MAENKPATENNQKNNTSSKVENADPNPNPNTVDSYKMVTQNFVQTYTQITPQPDAHSSFCKEEKREKGSIEGKDEDGEDDVRSDVSEDFAETQQEELRMAAISHQITEITNQIQQLEQEVEEGEDSEVSVVDSEDEQVEANDDEQSEQEADMEDEGVAMGREKLEEEKSKQEDEGENQTDGAEEHEAVITQILVSRNDSEDGEHMDENRKRKRDDENDTESKPQLEDEKEDKQNENQTAFEQDYNMHSTDFLDESLDTLLTNATTTVTHKNAHAISSNKLLEEIQPLNQPQEEIVQQPNPLPPPVDRPREHSEKKSHKPLGFVYNPKPQKQSNLPSHEKVNSKHNQRAQEKLEHKEQHEKLKYTNKAYQNPKLANQPANKVQTPQKETPDKRQHKDHKHTKEPAETAHQKPPDKTPQKSNKQSENIQQETKKRKVTQDKPSDKRFHKFMRLRRQRHNITTYDSIPSRHSLDSDYIPESVEITDSEEGSGVEEIVESRVGDRRERGEAEVLMKKKEEGGKVDARQEKYRELAALNGLQDFCISIMPVV
jgi:hypothetical protein